MHFIILPHCIILYMKSRASRDGGSKWRSSTFWN